MLSVFMHGNLIAVALIAGVVKGRNWGENVRAYIDHHPTDAAAGTNPCVELGSILDEHGQYISLLLGLTLGATVLVEFISHRPPEADDAAGKTDKLGDLYEIFEMNSEGETKHK